MANPHADLEKLEKAYTPQCNCGGIMRRAPDGYGWQCDFDVSHYCAPFPGDGYQGDEIVLAAVEEIRYLRQLVDDATTALHAIKVLSQDEHSANLDHNGDPPNDAYILASRWLESVSNHNAESAQKGEG